MKLMFDLCLESSAALGLGVLGVTVGVLLRQRSPIPYTVYNG